MTTARYDGLGHGVWIRDRLIAAGRRGLSAGQLFTELWQNATSLGLRYVDGTYPSFAQRFHRLLQLGWVQRTGVTEPALQKGMRRFAADFPRAILSPRVYFRITAPGRRADVYQWSDPFRTLYPNWTWAEKVRIYGLPRRRARRGRPERPAVPPGVPRRPRGRPPRAPVPPAASEAAIRAIQEARAQAILEATRRVPPPPPPPPAARPARRIEVPKPDLEQRLRLVEERIKKEAWAEYPQGDLRLVEIARKAKSTPSKARENIILGRYLAEQKGILEEEEKG